MALAFICLERAEEGGGVWVSYMYVSTDPRPSTPTYYRMLAMAWEAHAAALANAEGDEAAMAGAVAGVCEAAGIDPSTWVCDKKGGATGWAWPTICAVPLHALLDPPHPQTTIQQATAPAPPARVMVARDTRPHSEKLASLAVEGALLLPGTQVRFWVGGG